MAGHNKWSKIKRTKAVIDAKRGNIFSKLAKEITLAAKAGGGNPDLNARLRSAILAAKAQNTPNDNIDRAVKKGTGELAGAAIEEIVYEGYGPSGVAFLLEIATDNRNRTAADLRSLFLKNHGTFADAGSVAYLFTRRGEIRADMATTTEDQATEAALAADADDVTNDGDDWIFYTATDRLYQVVAALKDQGLVPKSPKYIYQPGTTLTITDPDTARQIIRLYDVLDEYDDTQNAYANFEIDDSIADQL